MHCCWLTGPALAAVGRPSANLRAFWFVGLAAWPWRRWLLATWLACLAWAGAAQATPLQVLVRADADRVALSQNAQILEDPLGRMTLAEVREAGARWEDIHTDTLNTGFSPSVWWVRVRLQGQGTFLSPRILDIGTPLQDQVDIHVLTPDGRLIQHMQTGDRVPFVNRAVQVRVPNVTLPLADGQVMDVYLRLSSHDGLHEAVSLSLWRPDAYTQFQQTETMAFGLYFGALVTVLLYNLFLFLSTRQSSFGWYSLYVIAFLVWGVAFRGYAFQYWWPQSPVFNNQSLPIWAALCYGTFGIFLNQYLDIRRSAPLWMHRLFLISALGSVVAVLPALANYYALSFALSIPFGVTQIVVAHMVGVYLVLRGNRPARYFLTAFFLLAVGVVMYYLRVLGVLSSNLVTENFLQIGSALEVLLLAFGLADQMNTLRAEKLRAERSALAAQEALNTELESLVKRRTRALENANQRLAEMAITDDLTGAFNRRHFNSAFAAEVARHLRHHTPMALCMLDIDQFKAYNDRYGHLAGDRVLQRVAEVIGKHLQRAGDQFFRLGGEEFGILLNVDEPPEKIHPFVDKIRAEIQALAIEHELSSHRVITASFGLAWIGSQSTVARAEDIYAAADRLLYQAKEAGRNRVEMQAL